jgi:taurine dioxygenase
MGTRTPSFRTDYTRIEVCPLGVHLGAEIGGVDLGAALDAETFGEIRSALFEHQVIVLRGQRITFREQRAFAERFGELSVHPFSPNRGDNPEVIVLDYGADNPPALTDVWHADETFRATPPFATLLCAKVVPAVGGDTLFASMTAAWDGLSPRMQAHVEGLVAEHDFLPFRTLFGSDAESVARLRTIEDRFPKQWHPVVRVHPQTGRRLLYVNPQFVTRIVGLPAAESRLLLDYLYAQARVPEYQFRVRWEADMLVMWDNTAVQHYAVHDYYPQRRSMERVTVAGGPVDGPVDATLLAQERPPVGYGGDTPRDGDGVRQFARE